MIVIKGAQNPWQGATVLMYFLHYYKSTSTNDNILIIN